MSRSNPYILKPYKAKHTILAFGEGPTEKAFLKYLASVYVKRESGISITYDYAGGKDPEYMICRVIKKKRGYDFDDTFILMDDDKQIQTATKEKADHRNIAIIQCTPCVEGLFLDILDPKSNPRSKMSEQCKTEFETRYLNCKDKLDEKKYYKFFTSKILEAARIRISTLDTIINTLTNVR